MDLNGTAAARRAGYKGNDNTLGKEAFEMLRMPQIKSAIEKAIAARTKRTELSADRVVERIDEISRIDILDAFDEKNCLKPLKDIPPEVRRCIASIEIDELFEGYGQDRTQTGYTKKIKLWDKPRSNDQLMRHVGGYKPTEIKGSLTLADLVAASGENEESEDSSE